MSKKLNFGKKNIREHTKHNASKKGFIPAKNLSLGEKKHLEFLAKGK